MTLHAAIGPSFPSLITLLRSADADVATGSRLRVRLAARRFEGLATAALESVHAHWAHVALAAPDYLAARETVEDYRIALLAESRRLATVAAGLLGSPGKVSCGRPS